MLKNIKKGFTIVELVIVIAVIAILAGVLIPTFSSITKNAKESAALQQARNAMEATLALTGASYPAGTDFIVDDGNDGKLDYWFSYEGNTLKNVTGTAAAKSHKFVTDYYAAYFSSKCFVSSDTNPDTDMAKKLEQSLSLLKESLALSGGEYGSIDKTNMQADGYAKLTYTVPAAGETPETVINIRIYYTTDIEPTLVIVLGENK